MDNTNIKETLEKQLRLLSERSENAVDGNELAVITEAMVKIAALVVEVQERREIEMNIDFNPHSVAQAICDKGQEAQSSK